MCAIAINSYGNSVKAIKILENNIQDDRYNRIVVYALVTINRDIGNAVKYEYIFRNYAKCKVLIVKC